ncbi:cytochrome oxidase assembly protein SHY1 Ecym_1255 [Eremothecium cymbalariae DBVPG|uniref:SURF1-like protein n=1 Tax=Eremothecium cymbalariae (strain CBS 270.75 / DBVPG 7215 / KCTC 17166 / NRRL Y-17582) TaxID=931890 RepID=G8JN33_ERECY|nr:hypothetical protein Ecym_1255 [Eremothecium cymbalariae DBVPG\
MLKFKRLQANGGCFWLQFNKVNKGQFRTVKTSIVDWKPIRTTKTPEDKEQKDRKWSRRILLTLMCAIPISSLYLGNWQLRRLKWKTKLIASSEDKLSYDPIPLPKNFTADMCEDWEYRKVILKGEFQHQEEIFVGPRSKNGAKGYILFTPFVRKDTGERFLIERGWISEENVVPTKRGLPHLSVPKGDNVEVCCLVRNPMKKGRFQWDKSDPGSRVWQVPDFPQMFAVSNTAPVHLQAILDYKDHHWPENEPVTSEDTTAANKKHAWWKFWTKNNVQESQPIVSAATNPPQNSEFEFSEYQFIKAGVPIGKPPKIDLRNTHLQYMFTWYGLSFLSTVYLIVALRNSRGSAVSQTKLKSEKLLHAKRNM